METTGRVIGGGVCHLDAKPQKKQERENVCWAVDLLNA